MNSSHQSNKATLKDLHKANQDAHKAPKHLKHAIKTAARSENSQQVESNSRWHPFKNWQYALPTLAASVLIVMVLYPNIELSQSPENWIPDYDRIDSQTMSEQELTDPFDSADSVELTDSVESIDSIEKKQRIKSKSAPTLMGDSYETPSDENNSEIQLSSEVESLSSSDHMKETASPLQSAAQQTKSEKKSGVQTNSGLKPATTSAREVQKPAFEEVIQQPTENAPLKRQRSQREPMDSSSNQSNLDNQARSLAEMDTISQELSESSVSSDLSNNQLESSKADYPVNVPMATTLSADNDAEEIEEVVVTGSRIENPNQEANKALNLMVVNGSKGTFRDCDGKILELPVEVAFKHSTWVSAIVKPYGWTFEVLESNPCD